MPAASTNKTVVVSDLHLHAGSPLPVVLDFARLLKLPMTRLIINGDLFDLDRVAGEPRAGEGLDLAVLRLERILEAFPQIGEGLRDFAKAGGQVIWLPGNHDAEISSPKLQKVLLHRLDLPKEVVRFEPETFEEAVLHIEHGHQQDPDNAFYPGTSDAVAKGRLSAFPLGCLMTRFLLCHIPAYSNRGENHRTPLQTLLRVMRRYGWATPKMILWYIWAGVRITHEAWRARRRGDSPQDRASAMKSPIKVIRRLYLDRIAALILLLSFLVLVLAAPDLLSAPLVWATGLLLAVLLLVPPMRTRRIRHRDRENCRQQAQKLFSQGRRMVIMGHTHHADQLHQDDGCYLNPGPFDDPNAQGRPFAVVEDGKVRLEQLVPVNLGSSPAR
jgi:UDP-2,3-diacylglucosamine pyrophosphatase LpxH